jgi:hypothetical protein
MKKNILLAITLCFIALSPAIESCQTVKSSTASKMLKFNFEKGKGYDYEMIMSVDQEMMGQKMEMDMTTYYSMDVKEDNGELKTISTTFDRFKMKMGMGGLNLDVDTDDANQVSGGIEDEKNPMNILNKLFGAIKGQRFLMKVNAEGKIEEISGFNQMAESIADSLGLEPEKRTEMMKSFNQQFNEKSVKEQFERVLYIFPNKEIKIGDTWQKNSETSGQFAGKYNSTYTVKEIEGDMVTVEEKSKIISDNNKGQMDGSVIGELVIDSRTGLVVKADQELKITATADGKSVTIKGISKIKGKAR